jgi:hypothetical protein
LQHSTATKREVTIPEPLEFSENLKRKILEKSKKDSDSCDPPLAERLAKFVKHLKGSSPNLKVNCIKRY